MRARRALQSLIALVACIALASWLGGFYLVPALAVTLVAVSTGLLITLALAAGLAWPVFVVAYVVHVTRDAVLRAEAAHRSAGRPVAGEPSLTRVEDAHDRER